MSGAGEGVADHARHRLPPRWGPGSSTSPYGMRFTSQAGRRHGRTLFHKPSAPRTSCKSAIQIGETTALVPSPARWQGDVGWLAWARIWRERNTHGRSQRDPAGRRVRRRHGGGGGGLPDHQGSMPAPGLRPERVAPSGQLWSPVVGDPTVRGWSMNSPNATGSC